MRGPGPQTAYGVPKPQGAPQPRGAPAHSTLHGQTMSLAWRGEGSRYVAAGYSISGFEGEQSKGRHAMRKRVRSKLDRKVRRY